jgi:uncharacterized repeat protein (TIGR03847 family)
MPRTEINLDPVLHLTADAIGKPGQRTFYLQGSNQEQTITLILEKAQLQSLVIGVEQFSAEIKDKFPDLTEAPIEFQPEQMRILPPLDPLFRIGELGLAYDADRDRMVIVAREIVNEGQEPDEVSLVRFWCTREQMRIMAAWAGEVISRGRPICPQCNEPMDPEGHFCPKKNGHNKH